MFHTLYCNKCKKVFSRKGFSYTDFAKNGAVYQFKIRQWLEDCNLSDKHISKLCDLLQEFREKLEKSNPIRTWVPKSQLNESGLIENV